jgi:hypothetical protein
MLGGENKIKIDVITVLEGLSTVIKDLLEKEIKGIIIILI